MHDPVGEVISIETYLKFACISIEACGYGQFIALVGVFDADKNGKFRVTAHDAIAVQTLVGNTRVKTDFFVGQELDTAWVNSVMKMTRILCVRHMEM